VKNNLLFLIIIIGVFGIFSTVLYYGSYGVQGSQLVPAVEFTISIGFCVGGFANLSRVMKPKINLKKLIKEYEDTNRYRG
jgi:hypothetical protein